MSGDAGDESWHLWETGLNGKHIYRSPRTGTPYQFGLKAQHCFLFNYNLHNSDPNNFPSGFHSARHRIRL